jgi:hypothetical protein
MTSFVASPAAAAWRCTDGWGRIYEMADTSGAASAALDCKLVEDRAPVSPAELGGPSTSAPPAMPQGAGMVLVIDDRSRTLGGLWLDIRGASTGLRVAPDPAVELLIDKVARAYDHDVRLLRAIVSVESGFNVNAVSPKGAIGLMQLMPATGEAMGLRDARRQLFDPLSNLQAGARYLRRLLQLFPGRMDLVLAAYNAGEGAVLKYGAVPPYPETQEYVVRVMRAAGLADER